MNESSPSDDELVELLTLTVTVNSLGNIVYRNKLGQKHRIHGPACIYPNGSMSWYQNGQLHRDSGPSVISANGSNRWYKNGKRHREDGPAITHENGPAIEWGDGRKHWYLYDEKLSEEEFNERVKSM